jgi:hypothetical protein
MNIDKFLMNDDNYHKLCKKIFKILNCNILWVMSVKGNLLYLEVSDKHILEYYWDKKYYLHDPNICIVPSNDSYTWKVSLGTNCDIFNKNGFLYDLVKIFNIEEFASIEKRLKTEHYCFRFFTRNNRFIFMNKLINELPIIKCFINIMIEKIKADPREHTRLNLTDLQLN